MLIDWKGEKDLNIVDNQYVALSSLSAIKWLFYSFVSITKSYRSIGSYEAKYLTEQTASNNHVDILS